MNLKKKDFYILEEVVNILQNIKNTNGDILSDKDVDVINIASDIIAPFTRKPKVRNQPFTPNKKHIDYLNSVRAELVKAEKTIADIRQGGNIKHGGKSGSNKWQKILDYLGSSGKLKTRPTKENGYVCEVKDECTCLTPLFQERMNYIVNNRIQFISAEETVSKIKNSNEWKKCFDYFNSLQSYGVLECSPTKENGYTVKVKDFANNKVIN